MTWCIVFFLRTISSLSDLENGNKIHHCRDFVHSTLTIFMQYLADYAHFPFHFQCLLLVGRTTTMLVVWWWLFGTVRNFNQKLLYINITLLRHHLRVHGDRRQSTDFRTHNFVLETECWHLATVCGFDWNTSDNLNNMIAMIFLFHLLSTCIRSVIASKSQWKEQQKKNYCEMMTREGKSVRQNLSQLCLMSIHIMVNLIFIKKKMHQWCTMQLVWHESSIIVISRWCDGVTRDELSSRNFVAIIFCVTSWHLAVLILRVLCRWLCKNKKIFFTFCFSNC